MYQENLRCYTRQKRKLTDLIIVSFPLVITTKQNLRRGELFKIYDDGIVLHVDFGGSMRFTQDKIAQNHTDLIYKCQFSVFYYCAIITLSKM